jgi:hypothetical protein
MRHADKPAHRSAPARALADRKYRQRIVRDKTKYDRKRITRELKEQRTYA